MGKNDDGIRKRIRLEQFRIRVAERKMAKIQDDQLADTPLFMRPEAADKIEELRQVIERVTNKMERLESIVQVTKQSQETVEVTKTALEKLRGTNLKSVSFNEKAQLVHKLGISIYPCENLTNIRVFY